MKWVKLKLKLVMDVRPENTQVPVVPCVCKATKYAKKA
jgi:hypothetical protein